MTTKSGKYLDFRNFWIFRNPDFWDLKQIYNECVDSKNVFEVHVYLNSLITSINFIYRLQFSN